MLASVCKELYAEDGASRKPVESHGIRIKRMGTEQNISAQEHSARTVNRSENTVKDGESVGNYSQDERRENHRSPAQMKEG